MFSEAMSSIWRPWRVSSACRASAISGSARATEASKKRSRSAAGLAAWFISVPLRAGLLSTGAPALLLRRSIEPGIRAQNPDRGLLAVLNQPARARRLGKRRGLLLAQQAAQLSHCDGLQVRARARRPDG